MASLSVSDVEQSRVLMLASYSATSSELDAALGGTGWDPIALTGETLFNRSPLLIAPVTAFAARSGETLAISFQGTQEVFRDNFNNFFGGVFSWAPLFAAYGEFFDAVDRYLEDQGNSITKILVTGHSQGGAMVEYFMDRFGSGSDERYVGVSYASPGILADLDTLAETGRFLKIEHTDDAIVDLAQQVDQLVATDDEIDLRVARGEDQLVPGLSEHDRFVYSQTTEILFDSKFAEDILDNYENLRFLIGDDVDENITGTSTADVLFGEGGSDNISGGDGNDYILGGSDPLEAIFRDSLHGGDGHDHLFGGRGNDLIDGGDGNDTAYFDFFGDAYSFSIIHLQGPGDAGIQVLQQHLNLASPFAPRNDGSATIYRVETLNIDGVGIFSTSDLSSRERVISVDGDFSEAGTKETGGYDRYWIKAGQLFTFSAAQSVYEVVPPSNAGPSSFAVRRTDTGELFEFISELNFVSFAGGQVQSVYGAFAPVVDPEPEDDIGGTSTRPTYSLEVLYPDGSVAVTEPDAGSVLPVNVRVIREGGDLRAETLYVSTLPGHSTGEFPAASAGDGDYFGKSGATESVVVFEEGQEQGSAAFIVRGDGKTEGVEAFRLMLREDQANQTAGNLAIQDVFIRDNESQQPPDDGGSDGGNSGGDQGNGNSGSGDTGGGSNNDPTVGVTNGVEIRIVDVDATNPTPGGSAAVEIEVENTTSTTKLVGTLGIYFSNDDTPSRSELVGTYSPGTVNPGVTEDRSVNFIVPIDASGNAKIIVVDQDELNDPDQTAIADFAVSSLSNQADLTFQEHYLRDNTLTFGQAVEVEYDVANIGRTDSGRSDVSFYLSRGRTFEEDRDIFITNDFFGSNRNGIQTGIEAGGRDGEAETITITSSMVEQLEGDLDPTNLYLLYVIDVDRDIPDADRSNNVVYSRFSIAATEEDIIGYTDHAVTDFSISTDRITYGDRFYFNAIIENSGTIDADYAVQFAHVIWRSVADGTEYTQGALFTDDGGTLDSQYIRNEEYFATNSRIISESSLAVGEYDVFARTRSDDSEASDRLENNESNIVRVFIGGPDDVPSSTPDPALRDLVVTQSVNQSTVSVTFTAFNSGSGAYLDALFVKVVAVPTSGGDEIELTEFIVPGLAELGDADGGDEFGVFDADIYLPSSLASGQYDVAIYFDNPIGNALETNDRLVSVNALSIAEDGTSSSAPTANDDYFDVSNDGPAILDVLANDTDPDGNKLSISDITSQPANGLAYVVDDRIVFDPNGEFSGDGEQVVSITYSASDGTGFSDVATVSLSVQPVIVPDPEGVLINSVAVADPVGYGGSQDQGDVAVSADGTTLTLTDNAWKSIALAQTITADTVLSFEFNADVLGEIHGIGFDTDGSLSPGRMFQLAGTQTWGIQGENGAYDIGDEWQRFDIRVGDYFTGDFDRIIFAMDDDKGTGADSAFRNIEIAEIAPPPLPSPLVNGVAVADPVGYGGSQDQGDVAVSPDGTTLTLTDNAWKSIALAQTVTADTVLSFEFNADVLGEIHGIGFDTNGSISGNRTFQLAGMQTWGIQGENGAYNIGDGWQRYDIRVGDYFTGDFDRIIFAMDDDSGTGADSAFRNIEIAEIVPPSSGPYLIETYEVMFSFDGTGFDATRTQDPTIAVQDDIVHLFYSGLPFSNFYAVGLATSVDNENFVRTSADPVISNSGSTPFTENRIFAESVLYDAATEQWLMYFWGNQRNLSTDAGHERGIGVATSTDLENWDLQQTPLFLEAGSRQGRDLIEVVQADGEYIMYLQDNNPDVPNVPLIARSTDGFNFGAEEVAPWSFDERLLTATQYDDGVIALFATDDPAVFAAGFSEDGETFVFNQEIIGKEMRPGELVVQNDVVEIWSDVSRGNVNWNFGNNEIERAEVPVIAFIGEDDFLF